MGQSASTPIPTGNEAQGARVRVAVKERYLAYLPRYINRHATLTEEKVKIVARHWNFIADEDDSGMQDAGLAPSRISVFYDAFYEKLFEKAPDTRSLFDGNLVRQSRALVKMVSWLCNLEVTDDLVARLEALADRHVEYGCLPLHYEAGGDALQYALRATAQYQDPEKMEVVMKAWKDVYSFVILVVIPRTALRLEESVRSSGPVTTMLRPTPISGTRLKVLATTSSPRKCSRSSSSSDWHPSSLRQGGPPGRQRRPPRAIAATPNTAASAPISGEDPEWFRAGRKTPARRPSSSVGPFQRSSSERWRKKMSAGWSGGGDGSSDFGRDSPRSPQSTAAGGSSAGGGERGRERRGRGDWRGERDGIGVLGAPWGGKGHTSVAPDVESQDGDEGGGAHSPGSSLFSVPSIASGLNVSVAGYGATSGGNVSPDGSSMSTSLRSRTAAGSRRGGTNGSEESRQRSKILRGLGKLTGGGGGGAGGRSVDGAGGVVKSNSPRGSIGARARAVLGGRSRRPVEGSITSTVGGPAVPRSIAAQGLQQRGRSSSVGASPTPDAAAVVAPGGGAGGSNYGVLGGGPGSAGLASPSCGSEPGSFPTQRTSERTQATPPLSSPASSAMSLPFSRSWEQSSAVLAGLGIGFSSKRQSSRYATATAPKSRNPLAATSVKPPEFARHEGSGTGSKEQAREEERTPSRDGVSAATGLSRESGFNSSDENNHHSDPGADSRSAIGSSPRDRHHSAGRVSGSSAAVPPRLPVSGGGASGRHAAAGASLSNPPPPALASSRSASYGQCVGEMATVESKQLQLPATSTARMEDMASQFNGGALVSGGEATDEAAGAGGRRDAASDGTLARGERGTGVPGQRHSGGGARRDEGLRRSITLPRTGACGERGGELGWHHANDLLGEPQLPVTPGADETRAGRELECFPTPGKTLTGSRRPERRADSGSRYRTIGGRRASGGGSGSDSNGVGRRDRNRGTRRPEGESFAADVGFGGVFWSFNDGGEVEVGKAWDKGGSRAAELRQRSWDRRPRSMSSADVSSFGSMGVNTLAYFDRKLRKRQEGVVFGQRERGNGFGVAGVTSASWEQAAIGEEIKEEGGGLLKPPRAARQAGDTPGKIRGKDDATSPERSPSDAKPRQCAKSDELAATKPESSPGLRWQTTEAIVAARPRDFEGAAVASSPPRCPSPFVAARPVSPFSEAKSPAGADARGSGDSGGAAGHVTISAGPSSPFRTGDTANAVISGVVSRQITPPMWKPARPIVVPVSSSIPVSPSVALPASTAEREAPRNSPSVTSPPNAKTAAHQGLRASSFSVGMGGAGAHALAGQQRRDKDGVGAIVMTNSPVHVTGGAAAEVAPAMQKGVRSSSSPEAPRMVRRQQQQQQQQQLQVEQSMLVSESDRAPMSLPPLDGSIHAPEADDYCEVVPVGPRKSRDRAPRAVTSPPAAVSGDGDVEINQAGGNSTSNSVSPFSVTQTRSLSFSSSSVTPPSRGASTAVLSSRGGEGSAGDDAEESAQPRQWPNQTSPADVEGAHRAVAPSWRPLLGGETEDDSEEDGGEHDMNEASRVVGPLQGTSVSLSTSPRTSLELGNTSAAEMESESAGATGCITRDDSSAAEADVGKSTDTTKVSEHGFVIEVGSVSAAAEARGGRRATADARATGEVERREAAGAAAAVAIDDAAEARRAGERGQSTGAVGRVNGAVKAMNSFAIRRKGGTRAATGGRPRGSGGDRAETLRYSSSGVTAATKSSPPLASPGNVKGKVAAMVGSWGRGGDTAGPSSGVGPAAPGGGMKSSNTEVRAGGVAEAVDAWLSSSKTHPVGDDGTGGGNSAGRGRQAAAGLGEGVKTGRARAERTEGLMEGLAYGNVREKANAWDVTLRSWK